MLSSSVASPLTSTSRMDLVSVLRGPETPHLLLEIRKTKGEYYRAHAEGVNIVTHTLHQGGYCVNGVCGAMDRLPASGLFGTNTIPASKFRTAAKDTTSVKQLKAQHVPVSCPSFYLDEHGHAPSVIRKTGKYLIVLF